MKCTHAAFKLAVRCCRRYTEEMKADACANISQSRDYFSSWRPVKNVSTDETPKFANNVGGRCGVDDITIIIM